jgi:hypothetical protein
VGKCRPRHEANNSSISFVKMGHSGYISIPYALQSVAYLSTGMALPLKEQYIYTFNVEFCSVTLSP